MTSNRLKLSCPVEAGDAARSAGQAGEALNSLVFLSRHVLRIEIENMLAAVGAQTKRRLPLVMAQREVEQVLKE